MLAEFSIKLERAIKTALSTIFELCGYNQENFDSFLAMLKGDDFSRNEFKNYCAQWQENILYEIRQKRESILDRRVENQIIQDEFGSKINEVITRIIEFRSLFFVSSQSNVPRWLQGFKPISSIQRIVRDLSTEYEINPEKLSKPQNFEEDLISALVISVENFLKFNFDTNESRIERLQSENNELKDHLSNIKIEEERIEVLERIIECQDITKLLINTAKKYQRKRMRGNEVQCAQLEKVFCDLYLDHQQKWPDKKICLDKINLSHMKLEGFDFKNVSFSKANLSYCQLTDSAFYQIDGADFTNANLERANLSGVSAEGTIFCGADLSHTNCRQINAKRANFKGAVLDDHSDLEEAELLEAVFDQQSFAPLLEKARLSYSSVVQAGTKQELRGVWLTGDFNGEEINFQNVFLEDVRFFEANLNNISFNNTYLDNSQFSRCAIDEIFWDSNTRFDSITFEKTQITALRVLSNLARKSQETNTFTLDGVIIQNQVIDHDLSGGNYCGVKFSNCVFERNAVFKGSNISEIDFTGSKVVSAKLFKNAIYKKNSLKGVSKNLLSGQNEISSFFKNESAINTRSLVDEEEENGQQPQSSQTSNKRQKLC